MMIRRNLRARAAKAAQPVEKPVREDPSIEGAGDRGEPSREEISRMNNFKLISLAKKHGIETDGKKAGDLRSELIERLGL